MTKFLTKNLEYRGYLSTFRAEITPKSGPFKVENNAQTLPKQLQKNFEKVQKMTFSTPIWPKMTPQFGQNDQISDLKYRFPGSFMDV